MLHMCGNMTIQKLDGISWSHTCAAWCEHEGYRTSMSMQLVLLVLSPFICYITHCAKMLNVLDIRQ